tara:strand:- start:2493 stop:2885 length:393 start_codon:yes stop_codon:yes gene_type:complete
MGNNCLLAFDFGLKHIGVAVGQLITKTATGITTIRAKSGRPIWEDMDKLIATWDPTLLIVGLPLNMDDTESEFTVEARRFAKQLDKRFGLPVKMVDERLTTREAMSRNAKKSHEISAILIAETWLNEQCH